MNPHLVDGKAVDMEVALWGDMDAREALVVRDLQGGEGLVIVYMKPIDRQVQVAAEQEANTGRDQDPVVRQHAQVVSSALQRHISALSACCSQDACAEIAPQLDGPDKCRCCQQIPMWEPAQGLTLLWQALLPNLKHTAVLHTQLPQCTRTLHRSRMSIPNTHLQHSWGGAVSHLEAWQG
jgi:hypothetical protein